METNFPNENICFRDKVFFTIVEETDKNYIEEKIYITIIKNFIKKYVMINDIFRESKESTYFKNCTKIYSKVFLHLEQIDSVFKIHNDQNFMTDFINFLIKVIFDFNGNSQNSNNINNVSNLNLNSQNPNSTNSSNLIIINTVKEINGGSNNLSNFF